jgi:hypothetical protein
MRARVATLLVVGLATLFALWGSNEGAWSGPGFYLGALALLAGAVLLLALVRFEGDLRLAPSTLVGLAALIALGAWSALSALWSPTPDVAVADAQRTWVYALTFSLGLWMALLLRANMRFALAPFVLAAGVVGIVTVATMASADAGDARRLLESDGTVQFPLGYRNANAAFFFISLFPAVGMALDRENDRLVRGFALAVATLSVDVALLSQSRGSAYAVAIAATLFIVLAPSRARALLWLALAALPAVGVVPALTALFSGAADGPVGGLADELHGAALATALTSVASLAVGLLAARQDDGGALVLRAPSNRAVGRGLAAGLVAATVAFVVAVDNPIDWIGHRAEEFGGDQSPNLSERSSRFTFDVGSGRGDLWEVALDAGFDDPLRGEGGGGYEYRYAFERETDQIARDAHSAPLGVFAELGLPGLILLTIALGGIAVGARRSARLGARAAHLFAVALAAGGYWLAHSSIDWFWSYPGVTTPVFALAGAACATACLRSAAGLARARRWPRFVALAGALVLAATLVPAWFSEIDLEQARDAGRDNPERAYGELDAAAEWNPLAIEPFLIEATIARRSGDHERALDAARQAAAERPEAWEAYALLAELNERRNPARSLEQAQMALALNPLFRPMQVLRDRVRRRLEASRTRT